jgi:Tfp pilus assembly protein FimT
MVKTTKARKFFSGHTFLELMTVIGILGIMLAMTLVSMNRSNTDAKLKAAQREVASAIRMAQSNALQGKTVNISDKTRVPQRFGFRFTDNNSYEVFYEDSSNETVESHDLGSGVTLSAPGSSYNTNTKITFSVPNATVNLPGSSSLELSLTLGSDTKKVTITSGGVVTEN